MKKTILLGLLLAALPLSAAYAHESKLEMTRLHVNTALDKFVADEAAKLESFRGIKAWPEGHAVKVRIYFGQTESLTYTCHEIEQEDGKEAVHCM